MEKITFEQLPQAVTQLTKEVSELKKWLISQNEQQPAPAEDRWLNVQELREYLPNKPTTQTVYQLVCARKIPVHKQGKNLFFLKSEIDEWIKSGKKKTYAEISADADAYLKNNKRK